MPTSPFASSLPRTGQAHSGAIIPLSSAISPPMAAPLQAESVRGMDSSELLQGHKSVTILHNGMPYRLQATKLGKLILTK